MKSQYAPGMRICVRDAVFAVRKVDILKGGPEGKQNVHKLSCIGLSEEVADREFAFITELEKIEVLHPEKTQVIADLSSQYQATRLYLESILRSKAPDENGITVGDRAAMDLLPYQLDPAKKALASTRARILIADGVGLGKTLEAGILVSELIRRGRGRRILTVTVKSMMTQFQKELWNRFTIPLVRLDSQGIQRVRKRIPSNHNPFNYFDKTIISLDTLKNDSEYRVYLENARWDIIIIDEAHHVSFKGNRTLSNKLADLLATRSDTLILLSATPHNGKAESFASLMKMLDPTAIADEREYGKEDIQGLYLRRFKKDIKDQIRKEFPEREIQEINAKATAAEENAFNLLTGLKFQHLDQKRSSKQMETGHMLRKISLEKALFSSPMACIKQAEHIIDNLADKKNKQAENDIRMIQELVDALKKIGKKQFSKYNTLIDTIRAEWQWNGKNTADRLVIFTERLETMEFLCRELRVDLQLKEDAVIRLHGSMSDIDQQSIVEEFGKEKSALRILVATDVASEGINLHFLSHRLVHFDIPWSLMVFQQRNGRIDRYGQEQTPQIHYCFTLSQNEKIKGDMRILEILVEKEKSAAENIGDPATLMGLYDVLKEELLVADTLEENRHPEEFTKKLDSPLHTVDSDTSAFEMLFGSTANEVTETTEPPHAPVRLYSDDYSYLESALQFLEKSREIPLDVKTNKTKKALTFQAPQDLWDYLDRILPRELKPDHRMFELISSKNDMQERIRMCRAEEVAWPEEHFLWELHPIFTWVEDKVRAGFGRQKAPAIWIGDPMSGGDAAFLISGLVPNRKGQPVLNPWFVVEYHRKKFHAVTGWEEWFQKVGFQKIKLNNDGHVRDLSHITNLISDAVKKAEYEMTTRYEAFRKKTELGLKDKMAEIEKLHQKHLDTLEQSLFTYTQPEQLKAKRKSDQTDKIRKVFDAWKDWVRDTMTIEDHPYLEILAVFCGKEEE